MTLQEHSLKRFRKKKKELLNQVNTRKKQKQTNFKQNLDAVTYKTIKKEIRVNNT